ncbi:MAG: putative lipid II flippase FtsW [Anaerolineae bacterium]|nr:putative lipid II flippase FtsW [Anaerolineae bacterium]
MNHVSTAQRSQARKRSPYLGVDVPLLLTMITLLLFGLLMVYSASWDFSLAIYDSANYIFSRQVTWLGLGLAVVLFCAGLDYHYWRRLALPAMMVTLVGLISVLIINEVRHNASRTLNAGSYMPSELAKLVTVIYLAVWLYSKRNQLGDINFGLMPLAVIIGLLSGLIMLQPDLSAAATIVFLGGILFFLAGGDLKQIFILLGVTMVVGWLVVEIHPTGSARMASYLEGIKDPTQASYHVRRSLEAFIKGGFFGVGIGKADTKFTGLPVPPTDSIFAVVGEETGIFGAGILVTLFGVFLWRGMVIARQAPDLLGSLLAAGMTFWIVLEAFVNMAVMVGLLPFAGNALPFISAGGSNLVVSLAGVGILMNISRISKMENLKKGRTQDAVNDLRRSQRRRRVSGAGRTAGSR